MSQNDNQNDNKEKELREQIRKRLIEQSQRIADELKELEARETRIHEAQRVHNIVEEERNKFYTQLGYVKVEDEDGTVEWVPPERAKALEDKIGEELDDLEFGQRRVRWFAVAWISISLLMVGILIFSFWPKPGSIRIATNVPGAKVVFNNDTTSMLTDTIVTQILNGRQIISVAKRGYKIKGQTYQLIDLKRGEKAVAYFELEPAPIETTVTQKTESVLDNDTLYERIKRNEEERLAALKSDSISRLDSIKH